MLSLKKKDLKIRKLVFKQEILKKSIKFILLNNVASNKFLSFFFLFNKLLKKSTKTSIVRRCIFNNRSRGVLRNFGVSRIYLLELARAGILPGYKKSVW